MSLEGGINLISSSFLPLFILLLIILFLSSQSDIDTPEKEAKKACQSECLRVKTMCLTRVAKQASDEILRYAYKPMES